MKPSTILRNLSSLRIPARLSASSAVVPLPIRSSFDKQVTAKLDGLQSHDQDQSEWMTSWLLCAVDASTTTQQITLDSLENVVYQSSDRKVIDEYLDCNTKMLDICNELTEKIEKIHNFVNSLKIVSHLLEGNDELHSLTLARAAHLLDSCEALETRCKQLDKCGSGLNKIFGQKAAHGEAAAWQDTKLGEILSGSVAVSSMVFAILGAAFSFKSKRDLPTLQPQSLSSWSSSLQELQKQVKKHKKSSSGLRLMELQQTVTATRSLRVQIKHKKQRELRHDVEKLKISCGNLLEGIKLLEGRVKELYKQLINVRMALLGFFVSDLKHYVR